MSRAAAFTILLILCCASLPGSAARAQRGSQIQTAPGAQRPVARPCAGGTPTEVFHAYSECNARDRMWHVVTDQEYLCRNPDGSTYAQTVRVSDQATADRCDDQPIDPNAAPRIRQIVGRDFPQVRFEDRATPVGIVTFRECINGFWTPVEYQTFRAEDGRIVIDRNRPRVLAPTDQPCQGDTRRADATVPGTTGPTVAQGPGSAPVFTLDPVGGARSQNALAMGPVVQLATLATAANAFNVGNNLLSPAQRIAAGEPPDDILSEVDEVTVLAGGAPPPPRGAAVAIDALLDLVRGQRVHASQPASPVQVLFTSLGGSTGEILEMQVFKSGSAPVRLQGLDVVLEPLKDAGAAQIKSEIQKRGLKPARTIRMTGYCVEFLKAPPSAGTLFRMAPAAVQQQFAPMRKIMSAARRAYKGGELHPDSDPTQYFHSIRQWALWTSEQRLDEQAFAKRFVEHTRKNLEGAGRPWTSQIETAIKGLVPNRWKDVTTVLRAAGARANAR